LAFAASLLTFARCRVGLQGLRVPDSSASFVRTTGSVPHGLEAAFRAPSVILNRFDPVRLSWDSFSCVPRYRHTTCASTTPMTLPPSFGPTVATQSDAFRPCGFSPLRRFTPCRGFESIAPRSRTRFAAFPGGIPANGRPKPTTDGRSSPFPATRFTPFEEFPPPVAVPCHHGRYPLAVLSPSDRPRAEAPSRPVRRAAKSTLPTSVPVPKRRFFRVASPPYVPRLLAEPKLASHSLSVSQL